jgi:hypothetical protein
VTDTGDRASGIARNAILTGAAVRLCIIALLFLTTAAAAENFSPAPLPDEEQQEPDPPAEQPDIHLRPTFFTSPAQNFSDGFLPGSASEDADEEDTRPTPGIDLSVPLP